VHVPALGRGSAGRFLWLTEELFSCKMTTVASIEVLQMMNFRRC